MPAPIIEAKHNKLENVADAGSFTLTKCNYNSSCDPFNFSHCAKALIMKNKMADRRSHDDAYGVARSKGLLLELLLNISSLYVRYGVVAGIEIFLK